MGLGHKGFDERTEAVKSQQREKAVEEPEIPDGNAAPGALKKGASAIDLDGGKEYAQGWKRSSTRKRHKLDYKHADDVTEGNVSPPQPVRTKVIDMTKASGPQSLDSIPASFSLLHQRGRLSEFRHNVSEIRVHVETELRKSAQSEQETAHHTQQFAYKSRIIRERLESAQDERKELAEAATLAKRIKSEPCTDLETFLARHTESIIQICELRLDPVLVSRLTVSLLSQHIKRYMINSPIDSRLPILLSQIKSILIPSIDADEMTPWESVISSFVFPRIQSHITNNVSRLCRGI